MDRVTLYLEYYNIQNGLFVGEIDLNSHIILLKKNKILKQETWEFYDPQQLNEEEFVFIQSNISNLNKIRFSNYDWFFQYRSEKE
jgi:hypothetical protein